MTGSEVAAFLRRYGADAPVRTGVDVLAAFPDDDGWRLRTTMGEMWCRMVVVATGNLDRPSLVAGPGAPSDGSIRPRQRYRCDARSVFPRYEMDAPAVVAHDRRRRQ